MKKFVFITLCIVVFFSFKLQSQEIFKEGNQWTYFYLFPETSEISHLNFLVKGDTIINGIAYKKIFSKKEGSNEPFALEDYFVRQDINGTTYKIDDSLEEELLMNNSALDSFNIQSSCTFSLERSISLELNNNQKTDKLIYSYYNFDPIDNETIISSINGFQWLENIGNSQYPFLGPNDYCQSKNKDYLSTLSCFVSDGVLVFGDDVHCSGIFSKTQEIDKSSFDIYPNPFLDNFSIHNIENNKIERVIISDLNGNPYYKEVDVNGLVINIDGIDFPSGMYIISIDFADSHTVTKKLIKL